MATAAQSGFSSPHSQYIYDSTELYDDKRSYLQLALDHSMSLFREISYSYRNFKGRAFDFFVPSFDDTKCSKQWKKESRGLYVFVHGLNGHPSIWQSHIDLLKNDHNDDLFVPYIPLKGNGSLEEVADPLLRAIEDYTKNHPSNPICLIGVSNGGRICTWLETRLRSSSPSTPIKVSTIAAVHFGSSRMNLINTFYQSTGWRLGYNPSVIDDLCYGSEKAKSILDDVKQPLADGVVREFEFFASTEDLTVPEFSSAMPKAGEGVRSIRHIVHGYNHNAIVAGVSEDQILSCREWMKRSAMKSISEVVVDSGDGSLVLRKRTSDVMDQLKAHFNAMMNPGRCLFKRKAGFWSSPADEGNSRFFKKLTEPKSQREDWDEGAIVAEPLCAVSNIGFIIAGIHRSSPELIIAGVASTVSHTIPKQFLLTVDKIAAYLVVARLLWEFKVLINNPILCVPILAVGAIGLMDVYLARTQGKTWPHVVWHLSAAAVADLVLGMRK